MSKQSYPIVNNIELASLIRNNMFAILEGIENKSLIINEDINKMGGELLNYNEKDLKKKNLDYFSSLPGQKIIIVDNTFTTNNTGEISFLEFLKNFKYTWYCRFFRLNTTDNKYYHISGQEKNDKPETRNKRRDSALFLDEYNNPIIFLFKNTSTPIIVYFKFNTIEIPVLSFYLYKMINDNSKLDEFSNFILESFNKYSFTNIKENFKDENYMNELYELSSSIFSLNNFFSKLTLLLDIISKHKYVVDKSKENNILQKKVKLLEENKDSLKSLNEKLEETVKIVTNSYNNKTLEYNSLHKDFLSLENNNILLSKKSLLDKEKKRKLRKCNALYFLVLSLLILSLFFIDYVIQPNKEEILEKCKLFLSDSVNLLEL